MNQFKWKMLDKEKEIEKVGPKEFLNRYNGEVMMDLIKSLDDKKVTPNYLNLLRYEFNRIREYKHLDKIYKKVA